MTTNYQWAAGMLFQAGLPSGSWNQSLVARWMEAEEPDTDWWHANDPLNVNNLSEGSVESFPNLALAAAATASVLRQPNMRGIFAVLAAQGTLEAFSIAVVASPWAASHYGGNPNHFVLIPEPPAISIPGTGPAPAPAPTPVPPTPTPAPPAPPVLPANLMEMFTVNCQDPTSGGVWIVSPTDGHVEADYGAPYCGGLNNPVPDVDNWQQVGYIAGITPWKDPNGNWGYSIIVHHNVPYGGGSWYSGYTFPRTVGEAGESLDAPEDTGPSGHLIKLAE